MSNNMVSQPLAMSDGQVATGNPVMSKLDASGQNNLRGSLRSVSGNPAMQQLSSSTSPKGQVGQMQVDSGQQRLFTNKRKALSEVNPVMQKMSTSDKKSMQVGYSPTSSGVPQFSGTNKKVTSNSSIIADSSKKVAPVETVMRKSQSASKNRNAPPVPSPKGSAEISDSVRSKLRESLASALALVSQEQQGSSNVEKTAQKDIGKTSMEVDPKPSESTSSITHVDPSNSGKSIDASVSGVSCQTDGGNDPEIAAQDSGSKAASAETGETWKFVEQDFLSHPVDSSFSDAFFAKDDLLLGNGLTWDFNMEAAALKEAQSNPKSTLENAGGDSKQQAVSSPESVAFMIESELFKLFGDMNKKYKEKGRSLVFNLKDRNNPELRARVMFGEISPERLCSMTAEELASKELSQWRSAKAEQLAQMKILPDSDANMRRLVKKTHKGEYQVEVEHDIVAPMEAPVDASMPPSIQSKRDETEAKPSTDAKLPSKTERSNTEDHDNQDRITIPSDGTDLMQGLMVDDMKDLPPILSLDEFMDSLDKEPPFANLPVDSEKTAPVSIKESSDTGSGLKSSEQAAKDGTVASLPKSELVDAQSKKLDVVSKEPDVETKKSDVETKKPDVVSKKPDVESKKPDVASERLSHFPHVQKGDCFWEGLLQISITSMADVIGFYKSGERATTKDWPIEFEIKGRVRLDAFEKFIHDLPMSRSRAIMVAHFVLKDGSNEDQRTSLFEVVDSYIQDQRVGFAEPTPGFEVYFCPPHTGTLEMLRKHLSKDYTESVKAIETGLIGIVVWRKPVLMHTISPNSSSHNAKRQEQNIHRRAQEKDTNMNVNLASRPDPAPTLSKTAPVEDDDDDDVPPGFGPPVSRDEDDLPEFKFTGGVLSPSIPHLAQQNARPSPAPTPTDKVEHMRQLIQKYGQNRPDVGSAIPLQPWNDDDDDDIPEWQPQAFPQQQLPPPPPLTRGPGFQQPLHVANQPHLQPHPTPLAMPMQQPLAVPMQQPLAMPMQHLQAPMKMPNQAWWPHGAPPPSVPPNNLGQQQMSGHHYMTPGPVANLPSREWRPSGPRSRGF